MSILLGKHVLYRQLDVHVHWVSDFLFHNYYGCLHAAAKALIKIM